MDGGRPQGRTRGMVMGFCEFPESGGRNQHKELTNARAVVHQSSNRYGKSTAIGAMEVRTMKWEGHCTRERKRRGAVHRRDPLDQVPTNTAQFVADTCDTSSRKSPGSLNTVCGMARASQPGRAIIGLNPSVFLSSQHNTVLTQLSNESGPE